MIRFKTDENIHPEVSEFMRTAGFDAMTVWDQSLRGHSDENIAQVCKVEGRALFTTDLGFSDIRAYPPSDYPGIVVLRTGRQSRARVLAAAKHVLELLPSHPLDQHLWIVDDVCVRIRTDLV